MKTNYLLESITLPCGAVIKNRLVKAAMTERMSNKHYEPVAAHHHLYELWANTNAGLLITGNVIIDKTHLESAGNVVFDDEKMIPKLKAWTASGTKNGAHLWVQISHAGRQTNRFSTSRPLAPSDVQLKKIGLFGKPKAMTESDIQEVTAGFVRAALIAKKSGFTGLQIHAAHGYLLSQFLSSHTNQRTDQYGGSIENRSRLLRAIIREVRDSVGGDYPISVKLNSSDFQKGGFTEEESLQVIRMLNEEGIDLLEISGGTYENVAFFLMNDDVRESTRRREAYFIEFAQKVRAISSIPLLITGGFRTFDFCNEVLENGTLDMIGMARPFITNVEDIAGFINGEVSRLTNFVIRSGFKSLEDAAEGGYYANQLIRLAEGKNVSTKPNAIWSANFLILHEFRKAMAKRWRW